MSRRVRGFVSRLHSLTRLLACLLACLLVYQYKWTDKERAELQELNHALLGNIRVFCRLRDVIPADETSGARGPTAPRRSGSDDSTFQVCSYIFDAL